MSGLSESARSCSVSGRLQLLLQNAGERYLVEDVRLHVAGGRGTVRCRSYQNPISVTPYSYTISPLGTDILKENGAQQAIESNPNNWLSQHLTYAKPASSVRRTCCLQVQCAHSRARCNRWCRCLVDNTGPLPRRLQKGFLSRSWRCSVWQLMSAPCLLTTPLLFLSLKWRAVEDGTGWYDDLRLELSHEVYWFCRCLEWRL